MLLAGGAPEECCQGRIHGSNLQAALNTADNTDSDLLTLQLEDRLQQAQQENTAVVKDVADMKVAMMRLQTQRLKSGSKASLEVDMALAKVGRSADQDLLKFGDGKSGV